MKAVAHAVEALLLGLALVSCNRPLQIIDTIAPDPVAGLRLVHTFESALKIEWIATGDDGANGRADLYEIRYSRTPPEDPTWYDISPLWRVKPRVDAGGVEAVIMAWLTEGKAYWVAIRASDEVANWSAWSEVVMMSTINQPPTARLVVRNGTCLADTADATGCSDPEDSLDELEVRWNWDGDETWDTPWSATKVVAIPLAQEGVHRIGLEVRDQGRLTREASGSLAIREAPVQIQSVLRRAMDSYIGTCCGRTGACWTCWRSNEIEYRGLGYWHQDRTLGGVRVWQTSFVSEDSIWGSGRAMYESFLKVEFHICAEAVRAWIPSSGKAFGLYRNGLLIVHGEGEALDLLLDEGNYHVTVVLSGRSFRMQFLPLLSTARSLPRTSTSAVGSDIQASGLVAVPDRNWWPPG
jgi:hypothetical protein